jgi:ketosteroid isomerase-like protein
VRWLFLCSGLLLLWASVSSAAGTYQRTRDGKTLVWNDSSKGGEEATWSGKRDKNGFAVGSGTLTWYKVERTLVTGSNIPDARRHAVVVSRYSGEMVQGKLEGPVTYVAANGKKLQTTFVDGSTAATGSAAAQSPSPRPTATPAPARQTPTPIAAANPRPAAQQTSTPVPEHTPTPAPERTPTPSPEYTPTPSPAATSSPTPEQTPTPRPQETTTPEPEHTTTATPTPDQEARQRADKDTIVQTRPDNSLRSLTAPPTKLRTENVAAASPEPSIASTPPLPSQTPPAAGDDAQAVAALDNQYQAAVKTNDTATMDRILADDFVLVTGRGGTLTKADLIKAAREKRTNYEHQEPEEGTQKVRLWGDTAVVTALLRIKGTRDENSLDYKVWFSDTYVRTPAGWRYVFGQASTPLTKPDAK